MLAEVSTDSTRCERTACKNDYFFPEISRGIPSRNTTSTSTSTKPPVNPQELKVLGAGPNREKPGEDGAAVFTKPHPPKRNSRPFKSALHQAVAPVRKLRESSLDLMVKGEVVRRCHSGLFPSAPPSSPILQPTPPPTAITMGQLTRRMRAFRLNPCY
ncbi:hypothetical protein SRHO_G00118660 [Serrasalmus rhombeus]